MKFFVLAAALFVFAVVAVLLVSRKNQTTRKATGELRQRRPLTEREQAMYFRLRDSLPNRIVLAQVAFSALLDSKDRPTRATFDRKVADFVVCSKAFEVIAVVELDDASHRGKEGKDKLRDDLLTSAGIKVVRFKNIPDQSELAAVFGVKESAVTA